MSSTQTPPDKPMLPPVMEEEVPHIVIEMTDRSAPVWAGVLSSVFAILSGLCVLAIAVSAVYFDTLVAQRGELILAPLLIAVGVVPLFGVVILDYCHTRALAGFRDLRAKYYRRAQMGLAAVVLIALALVHPLLGLGVIAGLSVSMAGLWGVSKYGTTEPAWDHTKAEAVSILSGRDFIGHKLSRGRRREHGLAISVHRAAVWLGVLVSLGCCSFLIAQGILSAAALPAVALITYWSTDAATRHLRSRFQDSPLTDSSAVVKAVQMTEEDAPVEGLSLRALSVHKQAGRMLLSEVSFDVPPGSVTGVLGDSGAGKSLLLRAISDPFGLSGLELRGHIRINEHDLWHRQARRQAVPSVYFPAVPIALSGTGRDNLSGFQDSFALDRGKRNLEQLVFSNDLVEQICDAPDVTRLPEMQKKALAFARGFLFAPSLYLMDRPEDGFSDKQISALLSRMDHETRLGRSFLVVTENRAMLERCDRLIILQDGRIVDYGEAEATRARLAAGWMRFVGARRLETEENLENWIRSHFKRQGDEANRRKVCMIGSELLAFSCQGVSDVNQQSLSFQFKHFEGYCILRLQDSDVPVGTAQMQAARQQSENAKEGQRLSPLARIMQEAVEVDTNAELDRRELIVRIETYDPRKTKSQMRSGNAPTKS